MPILCRYWGHRFVKRNWLTGKSECKGREKDYEGKFLVHDIWCFRCNQFIRVSCLQYESMFWEKSNA